MEVFSSKASFKQYICLYVSISLQIETIQCYKHFDAQEDAGASPIQRLTLDSSFFFNVRNRITENRDINVNSFSVVVDAEFSDEVTIEVWVMTLASVYNVRLCASRLGDRLWDHPQLMSVGHFDF